MFRTTRPSYRYGFAAIGLASMICATPVRAQVDGAISYDNAHNAYFVAGDASITGDISGNEVFVGKNNAADFTTLPGPFTLTVGDGAYISYYGNVYPTGGSGSRYYFSLVDFGSNIVNITGGYVNTSSGFDHSTMNVSAGYVSYATGWDDSTVNMSGGSAYYVTGLGNASVNITGGGIENAVGAEASHLAISGGLVQKVLLYDASSATITGGAITTSILVSYDSTLNLVGDFTTQVGSIHGDYDNGTNYLVRDYAITGNLADGTAFQQTITAAANASILGTNTIQLHGKAGEAAQDRYVTSDESVMGVYNKVVVGKNDQDTINTSPTTNLNLDTGQLDTYNNSQTTMNSSVVRGDVNTHDTSTLSLSDVKARDVYIHDNSTINVSDSDIYSVEGENAGRINIFSGNTDYVSIQNTNQLNISGGTIYSVISSNSGAITLSDGSVTHLETSDNSLLTMTGGSIESLNVLFGSTATISGGNVGQCNVVYGTANILGGTMDNIAEVSGIVNISGGTILSKTIRLFGDTMSDPPAELHLFGADLSVALIGIGNDLEGSYTGYSLFGTLLDGQSIDGYFVYDYTSSGTWIGDGDSLSFATAAVTVPESSALAFMGMTLPVGMGIVITRRRSKKRNGGITA